MTSTDQAPKSFLQRVRDVAIFIPFPVVHLLALGVFFIRPTLPLVAACIGLYLLRMWAVTAGYHRYFSHRTFKTSRWFQFVLAFLAQTSAQKGALWWAAHHRHHHKYSDAPEDIHSAKRDGFWWSHVGWILSTKNDPTKYENVKDLAKYPEFVWLNEHHYVPPVVLGVSLWFIGGWPLLCWGMFMSTVLCWHGTFFINSLCHVFGRTRYETTDTSKNSLILALITLGEGWHNNHHHYQSSTRQGFFWWEIDITYYVLKAMSWVGLVWELREPPAHAKYAHLKQTTAEVPAKAEAPSRVPPMLGVPPAAA